jgi:hypothetical protein
MISPTDPDRPFILLTAEHAAKVRGASTSGHELDPTPLDDGNFILPDRVLFDPGHAPHIPFLLTLPRCAITIRRDDLNVAGTYSLSGSVRQTSALRQPKRAQPKSGDVQHNPYERTKLPERGEWSEAALYESVGRACSRWEAIEVALADLFASLLSPNLTSLPAEQAYGVIATFRGRR